MMLANYNSDSGSESDNDTPGPSKAPPPPRPAVIAPSTTASSSKTSAVPAGKAKRKGPVKITLDLPKSSTNGDGLAVDEERSEDESSSAKKPKLGPKGKGSSALLNMLPPPKRKITIGQGSNAPLAVNKSMATSRLPPPPPAPGLDMPDLSGIATTNDEDDDEEGGKSGMLLPPSLARGKAKAKPVEPALDLFGLSSTSAAPPVASSSKTRSAVPPTISSAPAAPDFIPPEPTTQDPYPGYYQTPSGEWKAYDPEYYASFFASEPTVKLQGEVDENDGRVGRHWDEFNVKGAELKDVDVSDGLKAAREEEERKKLMKKPKISQDEFEYQTIGQIKGLAAQRHQLTSLLHTAYSSREEMEERIAQNKKNMRLAGQKYGF